MPRLKRKKSEARRSPPSSADVENAPLLPLMAGYLGKLAILPLRNYFILLFSIKRSE
jgi:hypothetical protein